MAENRPTSFSEAKAANSKATADLRTVANGKFAAGAKDPERDTFAAAPSNQYGPNAFDKIGGPRTTDSSVGPDVDAN